jgi:hypothetical protein
MLEMQARAMISNHRSHTRNEQESGSSPLVGSLFGCDLQENSALQKGLLPKARAN